MVVRVRVLYFARARELAGGRGEEDLELGGDEGGAQPSTDSCVGEVLRRHPGLADLLPSIVLALNQEYLDNSAGPIPLRDGDELAFIPPISGG